MIIPEVAPMLTCTAGNDGFLYELLLRAEEGRPSISKIRLGPYLFRPEHQPHALVLGLTRGGPEPGFWMHKSTPRGWSRLRWEVAVNEPETPTYLVSEGTLQPGETGSLRFVSFFPPRRPANGSGSLPGQRPYRLRRQRPELREIPARRTRALGPETYHLVPSFLARRVLPKGRIKREAVGAAFWQRRRLAVIL